MATILMTGELWFRVPEIIEVRLDGEAQKGVYPKDVILEVLGRIRADGAVYKAIDFTGSYVEKLNVAGRMTICNMAVEMGAKTAYMQPNADVLNYVDKRAVRPYEVQFTDPDFQYEESYVFDVSKIEPNLACIRETLRLGEQTPLLPFSAEKATGREALVRAIFDAVG